MSFFLFLRALSLEGIVAELTSTSDKRTTEKKYKKDGKLTAFNAVFIQVGKECLQTQARTVVKILTYASTNKYNITYTCYA